MEDTILAQVSDILKIPVEAIQNFDEEQAIYNISCNFSGNSVNNNSLNIQNFNPVEKIIQLHDEKIALYESMLKEKDEMMVRLEKLLEKK